MPFSRSPTTPPFTPPSLPRAYYSLARRITKLRRQPVEVSRLGARWRLYPRDWIDNRLIIGRPFEFDQLNAALRLIDQHNIGLFIDCGANIGLYSVIIGIHADAVNRIIACEPVPDTFQRLRKNIELNGLGDKVTCEQKALSDRSGTAEIKFTSQSSGVATISDNIIASGYRDFEATYDIPVVEFDSLCPLRDTRAFIKIDVEGHTLPALKGMTGFLGHNACILQIESSGDDVELQAALNELGYWPIGSIQEERYFTNIPEISEIVAGGEP